MKNLNHLQSLIVLLAIAVLSGCAVAPTPEAMRAEIADYKLPKAPEPNKAVVYVVRPSELGGLVRFNVFLDDQEDRSEMGYTRGGQHIYFNVPAGAHKLFSKAENWAETSISVKAGDVVFIQQEATMGIIMARNNLSVLDDTMGRYWVKKTSLGTIIKSDK